MRYWFVSHAKPDQALKNSKPLRLRSTEVIPKSEESSFISNPCNLHPRGKKESMPAAEHLLEEAAITTTISVLAVRSGSCFNHTKDHNQSINHTDTELIA